MDLEQSEDSSSGPWSFLQPSLSLTPHLMHTLLHKITYLGMPHYPSLTLFVLPPHNCPVHALPLSSSPSPSARTQQVTEEARGSLPCRTSNPAISLPASRCSLPRQHATKLRTPFICFPINPAAGGQEVIPAWGDASPCSSRLSRALLF